MVPRCQGGKTEWGNIVMACYRCNQAKADRTPTQADMRLVKMPVRPTYIPMFNARLRVQKKDVPAEWRDYWSIELDS